MKLINKGKIIIISILLLVCFITACGSNKSQRVILNSEIDDTTGIETSVNNKLTNEDETEIYKVFVQISGAVKSPGVYEVNNDLRVFNIIDLAGGLLENANTDVVNLTRPVVDEMMIYVPTYEEVSNGNYDDFLTSENESVNQKINLNSATKDELLTLPGIGESKANAIISYREVSGSYSCIEDIMNVAGIKQAAFDKIKELITV